MKIFTIIGILVASLYIMGWVFIIAICLISYVQIVIYKRDKN